MSVEWLKERNPEPITLPGNREDSNGPTAVEKSCFQEIRELKAENASFLVEREPLPDELQCSFCGHESGLIRWIAQEKRLNDRNH